MKAKKIIFYKKDHYSIPKPKKSKFLPQEKLSKMPRNNSFDVFKENKKRLTSNLKEFKNATYKSEFRKYFPLLINTDNKIKFYRTSFPFYCHFCGIHFYNYNQNIHENHSIIALKNNEISQDTIIKLKKDIDKNLTDIDVHDFSYLIIKQYENEKNNFYNLFNLCYLMLRRNIKFELKDKDLIMKYYAQLSYKRLKNFLINRKYSEFKERRNILYKTKRNLFLKRNIIEILIYAYTKDINKKVYFINDETHHFNYELKNLNDSKVDLYYKYYIYKNKATFKKYIEPKKEGYYKIYLEFKYKMKDMSYMFSGIKNIYKILFYFSNNNIINTSHMFERCQISDSLYFEFFNTENVTDMSYMFKDCYCENELNLNKFNTKKVTDMSHMFQGFNSKKYLSFEKFDFKNVNTIYEIITDYKCSNIYSNLIEIEFDISESDCNKKIYFLNNDKCNVNEDLQKLNESNTYLFINNEKYKYKNYFEPKNEGKYKIYLVFKNKIEDCSYMFANCKDIKKINLKPLNFENIINMSHMFDGCQCLKYFDPPHIFWVKAITGLSYLFKDCKNLEEIDLSFIDRDKIDTTDISHMFEGCENLKKINFEYLNTKKVTNMSYVFKDCKNISNLSLKFYIEKNCEKESYNNGQVTDMSHMFEGCKNLTELDISSFNTKKLLI